MVRYGEGNGNALQYSCLENPVDGEAWRATVHRVTRLGHDLTTEPPPEHCTHQAMKSISIKVRFYQELFPFNT